MPSKNSLHLNIYNMAAYAAIKAAPVGTKLILQLQKGLGMESVPGLKTQNFPSVYYGVVFRRKFHQKIKGPLTVVCNLSSLTIVIEYRHNGIDYQRPDCKNTQAFRELPRSLVKQEVIVPVFRG